MSKPKSGKPEQTMEEWFEEEANRQGRITKSLIDAGAFRVESKVGKPPKLNEDGTLAEEVSEETQRAKSVRKSFEYVKLTFRVAAESGLGKKRTVWAAKIQPGTYLRLDSEGSKTDEYIMLAPTDIISEKPARLNLRYGELEVI